MNKRDNSKLCGECIYKKGGLVKCLIKEYIHLKDINCPCTNCILKGNCTSICRERFQSYANFHSIFYKGILTND